jgi:hypothetical protein
MIEPLVLAL